MLEKIITIIGKKLSLGIGDISLDLSLTDDLGADSLDIIEIISDIEKEFNIEITDEEIIEFRTVDDLFKCIVSKTEKVSKSDINKGSQLTWSDKE